MNFQAFRREVKRLAMGKNHTVKVAVDEHLDGQIVVEWGAYIPSIGWVHAPTPEGVVSVMAEAVVVEIGDVP